MFTYLQNQFIKHRSLIRWIIVLTTTLISLYWLYHAGQETDKYYDLMFSKNELKVQAYWSGGGPMLAQLGMINYYTQVITFNLLVYLPLYFLWPNKKQL